ncbi:MAG: glycosyltransferase, partial [Chloroflexota bacterium]
MGSEVNGETGKRVNESTPSSRLPGSPSTRILFVDHADFLGGAERSALELLASIDRAQFDVTFACAPGALIGAARASGIRIAPLSLPQVRGRRNILSAPFKLAAGVADLVRLIRRERVAIVHSNTMRATIFAAPAARLAGVQFVWHVRDLHRERAYLWLMSHLAHAIIANSRAVAQTLPPFAQPKTTVVYNGVTLRDFDPSRADHNAFRTELGLSDEHLLIGNIGWFAPWKGQREFVEAAARIAAQCPRARFVLVGAASDDRYRQYERDVRAHGDALLGDKIFWAGERQPIQPVLAALD